MTSPFGFLDAEWPDVHEAATKAAAAVYPDPRTACFYARRALELAVAWAYKSDASLHLPYQDNLSALIHDPTFKAVAGEAVFSKARVINTLGNQAVHSHRTIQQFDALTAVRELFHVSFWLARTYARGAKPGAALAFDADALPKTAPLPKRAIDYLLKLKAELRERDEKLSAVLADKSALDEELKRLRAEVAEAKKASAAQPDTHDYAEAETRDYFIDLLLKEAGWPLDQPRDREFEVSGMPNAQSRGYVDYVLWADDGRPLAVVEAKRTRKSAAIGQQQAKLYADCLEAQFGQRPIIFYSNGYEHWLWDDASYPPRAVQGFFKKAELELMIQRRTSRKPLADAPVNTKIVERFYQARAIRRICEAFEQDHDRKALVVMATGAGKTRTVIALCDLLMQCNWAKRVLFLADRVALVNQAVNAFKAHLPDASPVNLVTEKDGEGRVFVSTYPTMMGLIDETKDGERRFGVGHFDLIVVDEAHRSVYQKYRAIFGYFDALLVGLTATPKDEIDINTYGLFDLERGVPTDAYGLEDAVKDGFLVPAKAVSVPLKFPREGITYNELPDEEKEQWDALEWDEDGGTPDRVEAPAVNKWLFNEDTVDKVLAHLMTRGRRSRAATASARRSSSPGTRRTPNSSRSGSTSTTLTTKVHSRGSSTTPCPTREPDRRFLEPVEAAAHRHLGGHARHGHRHSRGRESGLHQARAVEDEVLADGRPRHAAAQGSVLEFFSQNPDATDGSLGESLGKRLFKTRLELNGELDRPPIEAPPPMADKVSEQSPTYGTPPRDALRTDVVSLLHAEVAAMNIDNFIVRPKRRLVEKYGKPEAWTTLKEGSLAELAHDVAGLPSEQEPEDEEAKRFDLLLLRLQLAVLRVEPGFHRLSEQLKAIAGLLEEKAGIPMVREQLPLILEIQSDEWWQDVTPLMLETARKRLRLLVKLIDKQKRKPIYTDFLDEMGIETAIDLPGFDAPDTFERFRAKARAFLSEHQDHIAIHKLRMNKALTWSDLAELERMLTTSGVGGAGDVQKAKEESHGLGLFVRSLVGLDREAAKQAFAGFLAGKALNANQIEFVNLIVDHPTEHGVMGASLLYESPFTDLTPRGPDGIFTSSQLDELLAVLDQVRAAALAA